MIHVVNTSTDPFYNLALEEYFLKVKNLQDDILILWQNEPTIVVGKNQNTFAELNIDYVMNHNIYVVRRMSGGGAVYHDLGNLNYTIIKKDAWAYQNDFSFFALPVISCLKKYGIEAAFNGRNDITIDGKKFSGNAQYFYKEKVLHHGTLMFSSNLTVLEKALHVKMDKMVSKGIKSVKSRVTNISEFMKTPISLTEFRDSLIMSMFHEDERSIQKYKLTEEDTAAILELRNSKYDTWDWNYGKSPQMSYQKEMRFASGSVCVSMCMNEGIIQNFKINGDFFEGKPIEELEQMFDGIKYSTMELDTLVNHLDVSEYIHLLENEEFKELLFNR